MTGIVIFARVVTLFDRVLADRTRLEQAVADTRAKHEREPDPIWRSGHIGLPSFIRLRTPPDDGAVLVK